MESPVNSKKQGRGDFDYDYLGGRESDGVYGGIPDILVPDEDAGELVGEDAPEVDVNFGAGKGSKSNDTEVRRTYDGYAEAGKDDPEPYGGVGALRNHQASESGGNDGGGGVLSEGAESETIAGLGDDGASVKRQVFWGIPKATCRRAYVRWMATPGNYRKPKSIESFMKDYKMSEWHVYVLENTPTFWKECFECKDWFREKVPEVMAAVYQNATNSTHPKQREYIEWFLELVGAERKGESHIDLK